MTRPLTLLVLLATLLPLPAGAEHEVYYRYTVLGYVKDAAGRPQEGQLVELTRDKTGLAYRSYTDRAGLFVIVLRLGDESAGESLSLRHHRTRVRLIARFDAANHTDERGTRVDVEGARGIERPTSFRATLATLLGASRP
jgi:hypothetical protein